MSRQDPTKNVWPDRVPDYLKPFWIRRTELTLEGDCVLWGMQVVIPQKLRDKILEELHRGHSGTATMKAVARSHVWWPKLESDIAQLTKSCVSCQEPPVAPLHPLSWPTKPWQRIHVDFAFCHRMFQVVIDSHSKWSEVVEMKSTTSTATIQELRRMFVTYGIPEQLASDNGPQFISREFDVETA